MYELCLNPPLQTEMFGCFRQSHGWEHSGRILSKDLAVIGHRGEAVFRFHNTEYPVGRGVMLIIPAQTAYTAETHSTFAYDFLHLSSETLRPVAFDCAASYPMAHGFSLPPTRYTGLFLDTRTELGSLYEHVSFELARCREYVISITPHKKILLDLCVAQLLTEISAQFCAQKASAPEYPPLLMRMLLWIQQNYAEPLTPAVLSAHFNVSTTYIARLFRQNLNLTVTDYIHQLQLKHACELLRLSTMNINQIASSIGFGNIYYFSRLFRRCYGLSPTEYRRQGTV